PVKQPDAVKEIRGPKAAQAYDADNQPTKALLGFARGQGVKVEDIIIKELGDIAYAIATKKEAGQATKNVLSESLLRFIKGIPFQRSMRWGYSEMRFIRPIRWITAIFGGEVVSIEFENVKSGKVTFGHRFLSSGPILLGSVEGYVEALRQAYVLVDVEERRDWIWEQIQRVATDCDGRVIRDDDLLEEVTFLVEYPTAFAGMFSADYLIIPSEV
ncbi:MAG: glycine--tRNA ligase subunit beta, partial [Syntrophomonadaceae bacterium]|nr:glycine--tRNA ligase subunit beta [Syntrophomonadaceae bacterium]